MSETFSKVEVITGVARRRRFSTELKLAVVAETMHPACRSAMLRAATIRQTKIEDFRAVERAMAQIRSGFGPLFYQGSSRPCASR